MSWDKLVRSVCLRSDLPRLIHCSVLSSRSLASAQRHQSLHRISLSRGPASSGILMLLMLGWTAAIAGLIILAGVFGDGEIAQASIRQVR